MNFKGKMQRKSGITLISLVVTIVILLILAGITIAALTGNNGLFIKVQEAKKETEQAEKEEKEKLGDMEDTINEYTTGTEVQQVTDKNPGILEGTGTEADPYTINSIEDLVFFANDVTKGNTYDGQTVKLGLSLDFNSTKSYVDPFRTDYTEYGYDGELKTLLTSGEGFIPIGTNESIKDDSNNVISSTKSFKGTFDGSNNTISNLYIQSENTTANEEYRGLFAINYGIIKNLGLINTNIITKGRIVTGSIAGINSNEINNCFNNGGILKQDSDSWAPIGGISALIGESATIKNCYNSAEITRINSGSNANATAGGIVGQSSQGAVLIEKCYNRGNIIVTAEKVGINAGGIIGYSRNEVKNCYNLGRIEATSNVSQSVGGCVGASEEGKDISNCYNLGQLNIGGQEFTGYIGGICGANYANTIYNVFNTGNIIVEKQNSSIIGGLAGGRYQGNIINGYNLGNIKVGDYSNDKIGSIIGERWDITLSGCAYLKDTYKKPIGSYHGENDNDERNN